jgi:hypothetical protein
MLRYILLICAISMTLMSCTTTADKQLLLYNSSNSIKQHLSLPVNTLLAPAISYGQDELYHPVYNESPREEAVNQVWKGEHRQLNDD